MAVVPVAAAAQGSGHNMTRVTLGASLHGTKEAPNPGDPDGFGFARVTINLQTGDVCYRLSVANLDTPTASHIHEGGTGVSGPVVVPFEAPSTGLLANCTTADLDLLTAIVNNPSGYYVNVHTAAFPMGAIRGQLEPINYIPGDLQATGPQMDVVADGLNNPRGLTAMSDGSVDVAQAGTAGDSCVTVGEGDEQSKRCMGPTGAITEVASGKTTDVISGLPSMTFETDIVGPQDVLVDGDTVYGLVGLGGEPGLRDTLGDGAEAFGSIVSAKADGTWKVVADISAYEATANPDGGLIDTNPFSFLKTSDGFVVSDAGANALLSVAADGTISTLAVFPDQMVDAPAFLGLPEGTQIPAQAVPTGVTEGPDGAYYVGQLTGFPFPPGLASVWRVKDDNGDGDAMDAGETTVYASGFTNIIDVAFDDSGNLYVLEMTKNGLLNANPDDPMSATGALYRVGTDGTQQEIASAGLIAPTGMSIGADGAIYVSNFGVMPGMGQVVRLDFGSAP
jgi:hypothetical protein